MLHINNIPSKEIAGGINGKYVHGSALTLGYVTIKAGSILPAHHHVHEQITFVLEGELEMTLDNDTFLLTAGSSQVISPDAVHSAIAKTNCIVIDVFSPVRDDYK